MQRTTLNSFWRGALLAFVVVGALGASGCGRRARIARIAAGQADSRFQRYERNLMRLGARDTGCPEAQLQAQMVQAEPGVYAVIGCAQPFDYWLRCGRRNRCQWVRVPLLNESAAPSLQCAPQMIQQQPSQAPNVRYAAGCGRIQPFTVSCNPGGCMWAAAGPPQAAAPPQQQQVVVRPPTTQGQPPADPAALQSQVQAQREAILSCIDSGTLSLHLRWTADGQVILQLPVELQGTAAEGCIQAAVGALRITAQQAGEVVVPLQ